jgi:hypothetical protein
MTVVRYGGVEYLISGWNYTNNRKLAQRSWISPGGKISAVTILKRDYGWGFTVYSPDGELMDVGVCRTRGMCKNLVGAILDDFVSDCGITYKHYSSGFKDWLGLSHQANGLRGSTM